MKTVTKYQTLDNVLHDDFDRARRHVEAVYGSKLSTIAHKIAALDGKYIATGDFIDEHLGLFVELAQIKKDLILSNPEDTEEDYS